MATAVLSLPTSSIVPAKPPSNKITTTTTSNSSPHLQFLQKCTAISELKQIHAQMLRNGLLFDPILASRLVAALTSTTDAGSLDYARRVFDEIPRPTTFTFNSIIRAYTNANSLPESLSFYLTLIDRGHLPDNFTFPSLFKSCTTLNDGKQLHCHAVKLGFGSDTYVQNTLMNMYSLCGCLRYACVVFDRMTEKTIVSWATMIAAYTKWGRSMEALQLYQRMEKENVEPNEITLVNVLTACAVSRDLDTGKSVHRYMEDKGIKFNVVLSAALLDVYCKCGEISTGRKLFDGIPKKNLFCWNIMIKGHVEDNNYKEALALFREMQLQGIKADKVTMASLVLACSHLGALELGKWFHAYINRENIEIDVVLGTALVDMYAKCGCIETAIEFFNEMPTRDLMTWTALIGGLAISGHGERALEMFNEMQKSGLKPDAVTFVGVLTACTHARLVDQGISFFESMLSEYNIRPSIEHYGCVVDLLGRSGQVERAEKLIKKMPMAPDYYVMGALLGACRIHGNIEVAERTALKLLELYPQNGGPYVLLSNIYSSLEKYDEANRIRNLMLERNIRKPPACSMVEIEGEVHEFTMGDESHTRSVEIFAMVNDMIDRIKEAGYVPNKSQVILNMDEEEKESSLCRHSEKLAIAYALISTDSGTPIRIMKNLRVCNDCHEATKLISQIYGRDIIVRDRCRFHHFKDGSCSCHDFW